MGLYSINAPASVHGQTKHKRPAARPKVIYYALLSWLSMFTTHQLLGNGTRSVCCVLLLSIIIYNDSRIVVEIFKFTCPKVGEDVGATHPRYADPDDCQFFYVCINGETPRRNGCKLGQAFNDDTKKCDWARRIPEW